MLKISCYRKYYNDQLILKIDQLELNQGLYWVKGHNGSGKSTLFKSIAGLIPFQGDITFQNLSLKKDPVSFRTIVNYAEAEPIYPGFVTAKDLVRFIGKTKGASSENIQLVLKHFGVDAFYEKAVETFSSGMVKKLSLVLAFLGQPKLIVLDEPLITLDEDTRQRLILLIKTYLASGVMFLVSSHQSIDDSLRFTAAYEIKNKMITDV